jgi:hypothetical protein
MRCDRVTALTRVGMPSYDGGVLILAARGLVMVDAEMVALAGTGAATLVTLMVTDAWGGAKAGFAALLARRHGSEPVVAESVVAETVVAGELEQARAQVLAARAARDPQLETAVWDEWYARLCQLLDTDPQATGLLTDLVARYAPQVERAGGTTVITGNTFKGPAPINTGSGDQNNNFGPAAS